MSTKQNIGSRQKNAAYTSRSVGDMVKQNKHATVRDVASAFMDNIRRETNRVASEKAKANKELQQATKKSR